MKFKKEIFISPRLLPNYRQLNVIEAEAWLHNNEYKYITISSDGTIQARTKDDQLITGYRVYERDVPDIS